MDDYKNATDHIRVNGKNYSKQYTFKSRADAKKKQSRLKADGYKSVRVIPYTKHTGGKRTVVYVVYTLLD